MIRFLDIVASLLGLILLSPVFLIVAIWIKLDDRKGPVFYRQTRVGKGGVDFQLYKFRSMYVGSDKKGLITVGGRDSRITPSGYYIRKFKLDELPQLINILKGDMSVVGPRPEVRKYVDMYTEEQRHVLDVRPGLSDYASIEYLDENALLALSTDPDKTYVEEIMPEKIKLNMKFINNPSLANYLNVIMITFLGISVSKLFHWYFTKKALGFWQVVFLDFFVSMIACLGAYAITEGTDDFDQYWWVIISTILVCYMPIYMLTGKYLHTFEVKLRMTTNRDLQNVLISMTIGTTFDLILKQIVPFDEWFWPIDDGILVLGAAMSTLLMIMTRIAIRTIYDSRLTKINMPLAVLYGKPDNIELAAQAYERQAENPFRIYAFMTDEEEYSSHRIWGKKIYYKSDSVVKKLVDHGVSYLICGPTKSESILKDRHFVTLLAQAGIKIMISPTLKSVKLSDSKSIKLNLREMEIEDLLARDQLNVDMDAIGEKISGSTILVTGAAGSLGMEIVKQIVAFRPKMLLLVDVSESPLHKLMLWLQSEWPEQKYVPVLASITASLHMEHIFRTYRPDYVFHAASFNHVLVVEQSPYYAVYNNCHGTRIIADLAVTYGVKKFVLVSTDKAVNPTNVMGCSKRISEIYCQALNNSVHSDTISAAIKHGNSGNGNEKVKTQFMIVRIGNIIGSSSSVVQTFREQIKNGGPVTVTHPDIARYFIMTHEACKLMLQAGVMGHGGEIFVIDMGDPIRIADFAQRLIDMSGEKNIKIEYVGLRNGEKLYEDVISQDEDLIPTDHPMIRIVKGIDRNFDEVRRVELELEELSIRCDEAAVVRKMKEIVPEYQSSNPLFSSQQ